ncbi:MAG: hypothetical protein IPL52_02100 [Flavobacteriales bacterium]|nr:hypothetical protein [Flavobacteriales bacterium]
MRKRLVLVLLLASVGINMFVAWRWWTARGSRSVRTHKRMGRVEAYAELHALLPIDTGDVVLLGDSHFEYLPADELFPGTRVRNRGLSGQIASEVLERARKIAKAHPRRVLVQVGANDIMRGRDIRGYLADMDALLDVFAQEKVPVVVVALLPNARADVQERNDELNMALLAICKERAVAFADIADAFKAGKTLDPDLTFDGLHLNARGSLLLAKELRPYIE